MSHDERLEALFREGIKQDPSEWDALGADLPEDERRKLCELLQAERKLQQTVDSRSGSPSGDTTPPNAAMLPDAPESTLDRQSERDTARVPQGIAGYHILNIIAIHGQGIIYRADHPQLNRQVVIKLSKDALSQRGQLAIIEEGRSLALLSHPNIAQIFDLRIESGCPCLIMEYIEGRNLADYQDGASMPADKAAQLVRTLARAMQHAHSKGIIHRDLKPANVVIRAVDDEPKIIDFGLARVRSAFWPESDTSSHGGTVAYMAPEQARWMLEKMHDQTTDDPTTERSDTFALGAILYSLLTGSRLYQFTNNLEGLNKASACQIDAAALNQPAIPVWLRDVCLKALAKQPADRFQSAAELAEALIEPARRSRWTLPAVVVTLLLIALMIYQLASWFTSDDREATRAGDGTRAPSAETATGSGGRSPVLPDYVPVVQYVHFANADADVATSSPLFQRDSVREEDAIRITARFPEPRYCFLIALNPPSAKQPVQLCYPESEDTLQPTPISTLNYPSSTGKGFYFSDGSGQQVFLLVQSKKPLPPFCDWLGSVGDIRHITRDVSGQWFWEHHRLIPSSRRQTRGTVRDLQGTVPLTTLCRQIESTADHYTVDAVTFPVVARSDDAKNP